MSADPHNGTPKGDGTPSDLATNGDTATSPATKRSAASSEASSATVVERERPKASTRSERGDGSSLLTTLGAVLLGFAAASLLFYVRGVWRRRTESSAIDDFSDEE